MKKSIYLSKLFLLITCLLFCIMVTISFGEPAQINNIKQFLVEPIKESSDIDEILKGLQNAEGLVYRSGSRGNGVQKFQNLLLACGYSSIGKADGVYGSKTVAAVRDFQSVNNIPVTGEADLITQFYLIMNNSSFKRNGNTYIAQVQDYSMVIWPGKAFYIGALDKSGKLYEGTYYYFSNYFIGGYYVGEYKNNQRSGKGTAHFENGDVYTGQWDNDAMNGDGTYYYGGITSTNYYKGNMSNNMMNGKGTYYSDGTKITGRWSNNRYMK